MAAPALAAQVRLGVCGVRGLQARGFKSDQPVNTTPTAAPSERGGGAFAKREKAEEERYFRARSKEQLAALKQHHEDEIDIHKKEIERLQKEIERHKKKIHMLKKHDDDD
ncbi:LOW QUALITY PROTEIN: ATPase inhibitor, mitochondrial [Suncus etruscus]|uniref:LOW QUALITY PROTEIN: ATPase inhibitor, mitochondrial n=1 Tax=Suncus etruscus TaxID=109475 RepID=UPI00211050DE|nr:LOW QUALITY PROTEIN: ATPase inhibitor, mitochondrial [Suncus etruscus]